MRRMTLALLLLLSIVAKGQHVSLSQALAYLNEQQEEWTITFVADELEGLMAAEAIEQQTGQAVPEAVERLTKGLPVKVKVKKALRQTYVQRKQDKELMTIQGKVVDSMTRNDLPGAVVTLMTKDSTVLATEEAKSAGTRPTSTSRYHTVQSRISSKPPSRGMTLHSSISPSPM